jgi:hypothetical protein
MEKEREVISEEDNIFNDKGFSFMYNLTMVCGVATVIMFVIGTAIYLAVMS